MLFKPIQVCCGDLSFCDFIRIFEGACMKFDINDFVSVNLPSDSKFPALRLLKCQGRDQIANIIEMFGWKHFESPMPQVFYKICQAAKGNIIDVGANTGFYTVLATAALSTNKKIWAFEPDPHIFPILNANIKLNDIGDSVVLKNEALSNSEGSALLYIPTQEYGLVETSSSLERTFKEAHSESLSLKISTMDSHWGFLKKITEPISIIKIDVEGHESNVLLGAENIVKKFQPLIFVEVLPNANMAEINAFIKRNDYLDIRLRAGGATEVSSVVSFDEHAWNHILFPRASTDYLFSLLESARAVA